LLLLKPCRLKEKIFDEKVKTAFIQHELNLIATDSKSQVLELVYNMLEPYTGDIVSELQHEFSTVYPDREGNLYKVSRKYEQWLKSTLSSILAKIVSEEQSKTEKLKLIAANLRRHINNL
jgi:hypothetical protein